MHLEFSLVIICLQQSALSFLKFMFICYVLVSLNLMHLQCSLMLVCGGPAAEHCVEFSFDCVAEILKKSCPLISALMLSSLTCTTSATNLPLASK